MVSLRGLILLFQRSSPSLLYGSAPPPPHAVINTKLWDDLPTLTKVPAG